MALQTDADVFGPAAGAAPAVPAREPVAAAAPSPDEERRKRLMSDADVFGPVGGASRQLEPGERQVGPVEDVARALPGGGRKGLEGLLGIFGTVQDLRDHAIDYMIRKGAGAITGREMPSTLPMIAGDRLVSGHDIQGATENVAPHYKPQTKLGEYAERAGESVVTPGGPATKIISEVAGLAGKAAGDATGNPMVDAGLQLVLNLGAGGIRSLQSGVAKTLDGALENVTPAQFDAAQQLMRIAREQHGIDLKPAQAIAAITEGNRLTDVERVVTNSKGGAPVMNAANARQAGQVETAVSEGLDAITPTVTNPSTVAPKVKAAAEQTIQDARQAINAQAAPLYKASEGVTVPATVPAPPKLRLGEIDPAEVGLDGLKPKEGFTRKVYGISDEAGQRVGFVDAEIGPNGRARINDIVSTQSVSGANSFGPTGTRDVLRQFLAENPGIKTLEGERVSGARNGGQHGYEGSGTEVSVPVPASAATPRQIPGPFAEIISDPTIKRVIAEVRKDTDLGKLVKDQPDNSIAVLDAAKKRLNAEIEVAKEARQNDKVAVLSKSLDDLTAATDAASSTYAAARRAVERGHEAVLDPLKQGPVGQLAAAERYPEQAAILFGKRALEGSAQEIGDAVRSIAARDPEAARQMVRLYLRERFDAALGAGQGSAQSETKQFAGARFAQDVAGRRQQAENLRAAFEALPDGQQVADGFATLMQTLKATGETARKGSATAFNAEIQSELAKMGAIGEGVSTAASPGRWLTAIQDKAREISYGRNTDQLAGILANGDPAVIDMMRQLAKEAPGSARAAALTAAILGAERGNADERKKKQ